MLTKFRHWSIKISEGFFNYLQAIDDVYKKLENYNPTKKEVL